MDIEKIASASSNVKVSEPVHVEIQNNPRMMDDSHAKVATEVAVGASERSGMTNDGKEEDGKKEKKPDVSENSIDEAVRKANRNLAHTRCEYSYHKETKRVSIKVIDEKTDKVVREIPPEKSLDMLQKMWEMAGIILDEKR